MLEAIPSHENGGQGANPYFEYLLGDPGYIVTDMYVLRRVDRREGNIERRGNPVIEAFNKHHAGVRIKVEWGIGGLKNRYRKFLGTTPNRPNKFKIMFEAAAILTNFVHRRRKDFSIAEEGEIDRALLEGFAADWY